MSDLVSPDNPSDLVSPDNPKDNTLVELVAVMKQHYEPVTFMIAERFTFHRRCQQPGETVSLKCKFGAYLDDTLRDPLVCGLRSEATQKKLLTEADLTFRGLWRSLQATKQQLLEQGSCKALEVVG